MRLDKTFEREIRKQANGDGSREAKFAFKAKVVAARDELATPEVVTKFDEILKKHGRVPVAICVAATILERADRLNARSVEWARKVMSLYTNCPHDKSYSCFNDGLHPSRIEEYAGPFMRLTTE